MRHELEKQVKILIEKKVRPGYQSGGSGHLGYVGLRFKSIEILEAGERWKVKCVYQTWVETEFDSDLPVASHTACFEADKAGQLTEISC